MKALVLWGKDHEERAKELAAAYAAEVDSAKLAPRKVAGLTRLTFWGHGIPEEFCELKVPAFADLLLDWKKKNSGLDSVEILTCNGRFTGNGTESYVGTLRRLVLQRKYAALDGLTFRALPDGTTPSGKTCHYSILSRDPATKSWSYVATPGFFGGSSSQHEFHMFGARNFLNLFLNTPKGRRGYVQAYADMMSMAPLTLDHPYAVWKKMDQKKVDQFNADLKTTRQDAFILVGNSVGSLAWHLQDLK